MSKPKSKVIVALSGGVDSSVACALLLKQGYEVEAVFMKNWTPKSEAEGMLMCPLKADEKDARVVASQLGIKFSTISFEKEYRRDVVDYLFKEYKAGRTPNPDILCNSKIKFNAFLIYALKRGADFVATGHYVRKTRDRLPACPACACIAGRHATRYRLLKGKDANKDQSYFLYQITQEQLQHCLFPIGDYQKPEIRKLAKKFGLITENKPDSQGICFVGEVAMAKFLKQRIKPKKGDIVTIDGKKIGEHEGAWYYTIGQRRGIGVGGSPRFDDKNINKPRLIKNNNNILPRWAKGEAGGMPYYVVDKDIKKNRLIVARGDQDEALFQKELQANEISWISGIAPKFPLKCQAKIRYRQQDQRCVVTIRDMRKAIRVIFDEKQRAITPGQFIVFYQNDVCLGGGKII